MKVLSGYNKQGRLQKNDSREEAKDKYRQYVIVRTLVKINVSQPFFILYLPGVKICHNPLIIN